MLFRCLYLISLAPMVRYLIKLLVIVIAKSIRELAPAQLLLYLEHGSGYKKAGGGAEHVL